MRRWSTQWIRSALLPSLLLVTPTGPASDDSPALDVAVGGCFEWDDAACVLRDEDSTLTLWLDTDAESVPVVRLDDVEVETEAFAVAGGVRISVDVPAGAESLSVHQAGASIRMALHRRPMSPALVKFNERVEAKDVKGATETLEDALETAEGFARLELLDKARRLDNRLRRVESEQARALEQIALARDLNAPLAETHALAAAAFLSTRVKNDPAGAVPYIDRLLELGSARVDAKARGHYYSAVVARQTGDLGGALRNLELAEREASKLALDSLLVAAYDWHGSTLADLGRGTEAVELANRSQALALEGTPSCEVESRLLGNYGYTHLALASAGLPHDDPQPYFEDSLALLEGCPNPDRHASRLVDLALTELTFDRPERALEWLSELDAEPEALVGWIEEARARAAEGVGRWELVPSLLQRSIATQDPAIRWAALVRQAASEDRWGFSEIAVETYTEAEAVLDAELQGVAIGSGADLYLAGRSASARGLVGVLLEQGRTAEAMCRARLARRRSLARLDLVARVGAASLEARREWEATVSEILAARDSIEAEQANLWELRVDEQERQRAKLEARAREAESKLDEAVRKLGVRTAVRGCEALAQPRPGELLLVIAELERGWVVFAADEDDVVAHRLSGTELLDPTSRWLAELRSSLRRAERVVVVPTGASWSVPIHALPFEGGLLIDHMPVIYSLDLPPRAPTTSNGRALVVADPTGNLPEALAESRVVGELLSKAGWRVDGRTTDQATRAAVIEALGAVSLFHYAGHGRADGVVGWDSALSLHDAEELTVDDILALSSVPHGVVLTGCETGAVSLETLAGGMNLGRAFVLAGAQWVVAADVRVGDALAREVGTRLYDDADVKKLDGAAALRQALVELKDREGWEAFRVIVP